jgi:hypothetical protein
MGHKNAVNYLHRYLPWNQDVLPHDTYHDFKCGEAVLKGMASDFCKKPELSMSENYVKLPPVGLFRHQNVELPKLGVRY